MSFLHDPEKIKNIKQPTGNSGPLRIAISYGINRWTRMVKMLLRGLHENIDQLHFPITGLHNAALPIPPNIVNAFNPDP
jgi:hypothetical protein